MKARTYFAVVLDGMAKGLFASLIIGTIIKQIGVYSGIETITQLGLVAQYMMGPCIGAGIAYKREAKQFTLLAAMVAGALGAGTVAIAAGVATVKIGEPVGAFVAALAAVETARLVEGKTKFDLLIVPAVVISVAGIIGYFVSPVIAQFLNSIGALINDFTTLQPLPMGILLSVIVGIILTLPISSAALCISIGISGLAAGAALAGCCAQMVGFAVISYRENKVSGLIAQGLGTSMLQVPNIIKNPWIWLPPTAAAAVTGPLATMIFKMQTDKVGAGMGTSGLVGQLTTLSVMGNSSIVPMIVLHFLLPAIISLAISELMRKKGLIKFGDLKL